MPKQLLVCAAALICTLSATGAIAFDGLHHPCETAAPSSRASVTFLTYVSQAVASPAKPPYGFSAFHAALAYKLTGNLKYAKLAVATVDATVTAAETAVRDGAKPAIAGDSYLHVFTGIRDVTYTLQWCGEQVSETRQTAWKNYCAQAIYNVWNCTNASWYGKSFPWSGWSVNNPGNNYYYSFIGATTCWALYSNDQTLLDFLKADRWPLLFNYMARVPEGGSREGTGYGLSHMALFEIYGIWAASTSSDISSTNSHCSNSIAYWVHATTPNGKVLAPIGDQARVSNATVYDYQRALINEAVRLNALSENASGGRWWGKAHYSIMKHGFNSVYDLIDVSGTASPPASNSYFAERTGHYFARSDWTAKASYLDFTCGLYSESHGHQNHGAFDFWGGGGWLAVTENIWTHSGINQTTGFHNMVRFERSGAIVKQVYGESATADVTDDQTTLLANLDLTAMYPKTGIAWIRQLAYARPATLTVSDTCTVPDEVTPVFQLQLPAKPNLIANGVTAGNLRATILTPAQATITVEDWKSLSTDANSGWRVSITDAANGGKFVVKLEVSP